MNLICVRNISPVLPRRLRDSFLTIKLDWHILRLSMNMCLVKRTNSRNKTGVFSCSLKQFFPTHKFWYLLHAHLRGKPARALNHESEAFKMPLVGESWKLEVVCFITNLCSASRKQCTYSSTCPCFFTRFCPALLLNLQVRCVVLCKAKRVKLTAYHDVVLN